MALGKEVYKDEQNALYNVVRRPDAVAKLWFDPLDRRMAQKILALVAQRRSLLEDVCAWPTMSLHGADGQPVGFLMRQVDPAQFRRLEQLYHLGTDRNSLPGSWPTSWLFRMQVGSRLAQAFAIVHEAGQVIGDVSERHMLVSAQGQVKLIGADSFQVTTPDESFASRTGLLQFTPPELQAGGIAAQQRTPQHDNFGLAVLIFKLLFGGRHPYSGVPVGRPMPSPGEAIASDAYAYAAQPRPYVKPPPGVYGPEVLPPTVRRMFEQAFSPARGPRPDARKWQTVLNDLGQALVPCGENPAHQRVEGFPCPQCEAGQVSPEAVAPKADLSGAAQRLWQKVQDAAPPGKSSALPDIPDPQRLPPLPLNLPPRPRSVLRPQTQELALRWLIRLLVLAALIALVNLIQKSVLAAVIEVGAALLVVTLGRRISVDWDGLIDHFQNAEGRLVERLTPTQGQWQAYYAAVEKKRREVRGRFQELHEAYQQMETRYGEENAYAQYQRELHKLDQQRRHLLQGSEQGDRIQALIDAQASEALSDYLRRQPVAPNTVASLSPRLALHLTSMGVRRASDVQSSKLKVIRGDLAEELTEWRSDLVEFFHFNPDSIPPTKLEAARQQGQLQSAAAFRQFDEGVKQFVNTDWQSKENAMIEQLRGLKAQAKQYQNALRALEAQNER